MSACQADPWQVTKNSINQESASTEAIEKFEDNFIPNKVEGNSTSDIGDSNGTGAPRLEPLPDSANYLQVLERKLQKLQKNSKLLDSLQQKKQDCLRALLDTNGAPQQNLEELHHFDTPIESGRLHRHLLPVQAVTIGETLEIVKYDALEDQVLNKEQQVRHQDETSKEEN